MDSKTKSDERALKDPAEKGEPDPGLLAAMLEAREQRWARRMMLAEKHPSLISLTLCVPLPQRLSPEGKLFLRQAARELEENLRQAGFAPEEAEYLEGADGLAVFLPCRSEAEALKRFCVKEEETLPAGRLLDIDVTKEGGLPIGRAELGLPPRKCFLCGRPAAECVAGARHAPEAAAAYVEALLARQRGKTTKKGEYDGTADPFVNGQ